MANKASHVRVVPAQHMLEGGGFVVQPPFPVPGLSYFDPILLIDEMGPVHYGPGEAIGAPDHPHRGFETVTYIIDGAMQHEDSHGHRGVIRSGDVQWMTAGAGVIHSEMPSAEMLRDGGLMHGFQIWVNLPRDKKMMQPRYQEYTSSALPIVEGEGRWVRIIAGESGFEALLISGVPLGEPVARYGPFVMNTHDEIVQAIADLQAGKFGEIARN